MIMIIIQKFSNKWKTGCPPGLHRKIPITLNSSNFYIKYNKPIDTSIGLLYLITEVEMNSKTKDNIINAARKAFSENGYHNTSVSDIIQSIGMAQGTFYHHFKNKRSLFEDMLQNFTDMLVTKIESNDIDKITDNESYISMGYNLGLSVIQVFMEDRALARIFFWEAVGIDSGLNEIIDSAYRRVTDYTQKYIEKGQSLGIVREDLHGKIMAVSMVGTSMHVINRYLRDDLSEFPENELLDSVIKMHLGGIMKR